jgi:hypothetical protein
MSDCPHCDAQPTALVPEHVRTIAALNATIVARDATIILRDASIALQSADIAGLTDTLAQRNAKIIDMQNEIDGLNAAVAVWGANWPKNTCPKCMYSPDSKVFERPPDCVPPTLPTIVQGVEE